MQIQSHVLINQCLDKGLAGRFSELVLHLENPDAGTTKSKSCPLKEAIPRRPQPRGQSSPSPDLPEAHGSQQHCLVTEGNSLTLPAAWLPLGLCWVPNSWNGLILSPLLVTSESDHHDFSRLEIFLLPEVVERFHVSL